MSEATPDRPWLRFYEPGVPHTLRYPRASVQSLLDESAAQFGDRSAAVFFGAALSYRALHTLVHRFAGALHRLGVRPGDRVSLHLPNSPQFLIAYYGALRAGAVVVPFNPLYVEREIEHQLIDSGAEVAVTLNLFYPRLADVRPRTRVREIIVTSINAYFPPLLRWLYPLNAWREGHLVRVPRGRDVHRFSELLDADQPAPPEAIDPEQTALLLYSGGTTGTPKGVILSHRNLVCNVVQARAWFTGLRAGEDSILAVIPFFHSYGMTAAMNLAVSAGERLILLPRFQAEMVLGAIAAYKPRLFPGVPTLYTAIISHPDVSRYNLRSGMIAV